MATDGNVRKSERVPLSASAQVAVGPQALVGRLRDISCGGACLVVDGSSHLAAGDGVALRFRLPIGFWIAVTGIIRWVRAGDELGAGTSFGVAFQQLDTTTAQFIEYYVRDAGEAIGTAEFDTSIVEKYAAHVSSKGVLRVRLGQHLTEDDCARLVQLMGDELSKQGAQPIAFVIDATRFTVCTTKAVAGLRKVLSRLAENGTMVGALVAGPGLASGQVLRLARETGIASSMMQFDRLDDAERFLDEIAASAAGAAH